MISKKFLPVSKAATFLLLVVLAGLIAFAGRAALGEFVRNLRLRKELVKLERELTQLEGNAGMLQQQLASLERPFAIEREARMKYGLRRSGERVLVVPEKSAPTPEGQSSDPFGASGRSETSESAAQSSEGEGWRANALAWWRYFAGNPKP